MRKAEIKRKTGETNISLSLNLDGSGKGEINTGCGFLDHMLTLFKKHGCFDLTVKAKGDTNVYLLTGSDLTALCGNEGTVDNCHPTDFGFAAMAKAICDLIEKKNIKLI